MEDSIYKLLDSERSNNIKRDKLYEYLHEKLKLFKEDNKRGEELAYGITGLLSTEFGQGLSEDDPLSKIFTICADLELPQNHRAQVGS